MSLRSGSFYGDESVVLGLTASLESRPISCDDNFQWGRDHSLRTDAFSGLEPSFWTTTIARDETLYSGPDSLRMRIFSNLGWGARTFFT